MHILCLKGFAVEVTAVNPPERVFNQNEDVSRDMERVGDAPASTTWSVPGFVKVN